MSRTVLHETSYGLGKPGQTYHLERTYAVSWRGVKGQLHNQLIEHKIRVTVHVDSRPSQSRYLAEVWTPRGWTAADHIAGADPRMVPPPGAERRGQEGIASGWVPHEHQQEKADSLEWAAELLLERALAVLK